MAGSKTNAHSDSVLNVLRGSNITAPANIYIALFTAAPGEAGGGTEVTGGSYARQVITFAAPSGGNPRSISNTAQIDFPAATGTWGDIIGWALFDASSAGNMLYYGDVTSKNIAITDIYRFAAGAVVVTEG